MTVDTAAYLPDKINFQLTYCLIIIPNDAKPCQQSRIVLFRGYNQEKEFTVGCIIYINRLGTFDAYYMKDTLVSPAIHYCIDRYGRHSLKTTHKKSLFILLRY